MRVADVYLGIGEGALAMDGEAASWRSHEAMAAGLDALFGQAAAAGRGAVRLWVSGALARPFLCGPVGGLKRWREAQAYARACAPEATGIDTDCSVALEDWPGERAALAVAMAETTLSTIHVAAAAHRLGLRSIRPWWAEAVNRLRANADLVAVDDGDALTLVGWRVGVLQSANAYLPAPTGDQADKLLARLALTGGVAPAAVRRVAIARDGGAGVDGVPFGAVA